MNLVNVSNYLNHHQYPLCSHFNKICDDFTFISTTEPNAKKLKLGFANYNDQDFVFKCHNLENQDKALKMICDADVVIFGGGSYQWIAPRMEENRLSFLHAERFFKKGWWQRYKPTTRRKRIQRSTRQNGKAFHLLCAGGFLAKDARSIGFQNKCYRWGYFPKFENLDIKSNLANKARRKTVEIIFVGRLIKWKHPEHPVKAVANLLKEGVDCRLSIIGMGPQKTMLKKIIDRTGLSDRIILKGAIPSDEVNAAMQKADIMVFPSDHHEGWGAVCNQAMSSGCAVIASSETGSSRSMIRHGENGWFYNYGDIDTLTALLKDAIQDVSMRNQVAETAYNSIAKLWNHEVAAERFVAMCEAMLKGDNPPIWEDGPCSEAPVLNKKLP